MSESRLSPTAYVLIGIAIVLAWEVISPHPILLLILVFGGFEAVQNIFADRQQSVRCAGTPADRPTLKSAA